MFIEFRKRFRRRIRRRTSAAAKFDLPEPIIQLIQSFLTSKEAAQTTLLSKSWGSAWLTRPNLDFDLADFRYLDGLMEFAGKTLERYENSNLKIHSFRLSMTSVAYCGYGHATKLVRRALKLGPTRVTFDFDCSSCFDIPGEVFRYENLLSLTVKGCGIDLNQDELRCSRLRSLSLYDVQTQPRDMIPRIISSCPLIEHLSLDQKNVAYIGDTLQTNISLHRLTSLVLNCVNFDPLFLADLSSKLPSLKAFTLSIIKTLEEIQISSPTLESLSFDTGQFAMVHRIKLDVPSIRKLTFVCKSVPELSVRSNSRGWESYVSAKHLDCLSASCFYILSNFIRELRFSRISLSLYVYCRNTFNYEVGDILGLPKPEIENLNIYHEHMPSISCYALFDGLFRICRPKVITQYKSSYGTNNNISFLVKRLLDAREAKVLIANQLMYGLNDLKEARAQVLDEAASTWRDVSLDSLQDEDSTTVENYSVSRFQLNWKQ